MSRETKKAAKRAWLASWTLLHDFLKGYPPRPNMREDIERHFDEWWKRGQPLRDVVELVRCRYTYESDRQCALREGHETLGYPQHQMHEAHNEFLNSDGGLFTMSLLKKP